jgi:hypothetical protein
MHRIFYLSRSLASPTDLESIVGKARQANARCSVTGALLYSGAHFAQLLEGPESAVAQTMSRIERDTRHDTVIRLIDGPASERSTDGWTMAFIDAPGADELIARLLADPAAAAARGEHLLDLLLRAIQVPPDAT